MLELHQILLSIAPALGTNVGIVEQIIKGVYCISSGGVTMKNISRWTGKGGSYRNIQRFFSNSVDWLGINILLLRTLIIGVPASKDYVLAFDEVVEDKSGKKTHGLGWFYSSIAGKTIRSVSHHVVSLVNTKQENSFVLTSEQTIKAEQKKNKKKSSQDKISKEQQHPKRKAGRPKGSKNKQNVKSTGLLYQSFELLLSVVVPLILLYCPNLRYVVADGAYGNKTCCLIVFQFDLELISKLNRNTALYLPCEGKRGGRGRPRKYGKKADYKKLPSEYLVCSSEEDKIETKVYQIQGVWTKKMPRLINVVIIVKTDLITQKTGRVVLFSTDLTLQAQELIKFYSLRFQIEFNFRDAKQYFGLADFKNTKPTQLKNAVGLSFFMDNLSMILTDQAKQLWQEETVSIQDLKAYFRGEKYLGFILNTLELDQKDILNRSEIQQVLKIGAINRPQARKVAS